MKQLIRINEQASLDRPAWSSMKSTGLLDAYKHLHINKKNQPIRKNFFEKKNN